MENFEAHMPCCACGKSGEGMVTFHHVYSQKAYPEFKLSKFNLMPLCKYHHTMIHTKSMTYVADNYPGVLDFLKRNEWEFLPDFRKWIHLHDSEKM